MENINYDILCHIAEKCECYETLTNLEKCFQTTLPLKYFKISLEKIYKNCIATIISNKFFNYGYTFIDARPGKMKCKMIVIKNTLPKF